MAIEPEGTVGPRSGVPSPSPDTHDNSYLVMSIGILIIAIVQWVKFLLAVKPVPQDAVNIGIISFSVATPIVALIFLLLKRAPGWPVAIMFVNAILAIVGAFAWIYWDIGSAHNFSISTQLSHLDAVYFTLGALTTGSGNIAAISERSREIQTIQLVFDLVLMGFVAAVVFGRFPDYIRRSIEPTPPVPGTSADPTQPPPTPTDPPRPRQERGRRRHRYKPSAEAEQKYQADVARTARRQELLDAAHEAENQLRQAQARRAPAAEVRRLAEGLDTALTDAMRAVYAAQRAEIGPRGYEDRIYRRKARATPRVHALTAEAERLLTLRETHRLNGLPAVTFEPNPPPSDVDK